MDAELRYLGIIPFFLVWPRIIDDWDLLVLSAELGTNKHVTKSQHSESWQLPYGGTAEASPISNSFEIGLLQNTSFETKATPSDTATDFEF